MGAGRGVEFGGKDSEGDPVTSLAEERVTLEDMSVHSETSMSGQGMSIFFLSFSCGRSG